jgi:hypothetical protein
MPQTRKDPLRVVRGNLVIEKKNLKASEVFELFAAEGLFA